MFSKIYKKLYFWFLLVFLLTILVVSITIHTLYSERLRDELEEQLQAHATFLSEAYEEACSNADSQRCKSFLLRIERMRPLHFWILNPQGDVVVSNQQDAPALKPNELNRAISGDTLVSMRRRHPPRVVVPVRDDAGQIKKVAVVERAWARGRRFPAPFLASLIVVLITIAIAIRPLSKRLTRPVLELHSLGKDWAEGHLEKRALVSGKDEISDLATTFNTMAEKLQTMLQQRKEFMASISHELKSPLARMRVALELLSEKHPDAEPLLSKLREEIGESEKLIEQLLVLSRIEMNVAFAPDSFPAEKLVSHIVEQAQPLAHRAGVKLVVEGSAMIKADFYQLEKALTNIVENAIKFSSSGSEVWIKIKKQDGQIRLECRDEGSGVTAEDLTKIFEPFYRGADIRTKDGAGLGLFIARRIVEMHGGSIYAEQNLPKGTAIVMLLPAV